ncbi:MAG: hypothetical protein OEQ53_13935, partial [Saprospiraceae bacterium]|nr:hypothetical protein [Saprospiraceae bacterium]
MDAVDRNVVTSEETRKLAAVMFTDIAGYTAMAQKDERSALSSVETHRRLLHELGAQYQGQIVQFYGDGSLSLFPSIIDSLLCATKLQQAFQQQGLPVRIGIHLGDIVMKDGDVFGDGVNMASRIQEQGVPGSILISGKVQRELLNHPEIESVSLGHFRLKNIEKRLEIFAISHPDLSIPSKGSLFTQLRRTSGLTKYLLGFVAVVIIGLLLLKQSELSQLINSSLSNLNDVEKEMIAVPLFQNFTLDDSLDVVSDMASHWITKGLLETSKASVISYESVRESAPFALASVGARQSFAKTTGVVNIVDGSYYAQGLDSLLFTVIIRDLDTDNPLKISIPDEVAHRSNPLPAINRLLSSLKGYWESKDDKLASLPNYEAYKAFIKAKHLWISNYPEAEKELKRSVALDPNFFDSHFLMIPLYRNRGSYDEAAQVVQELDQRFEDLNIRQRNLVASRDAGLKGNNKVAFEHFLLEYAINPKDLFTNTAMMVHALEYVNDSDKAIEVFEQINLDSFEVGSCAYCLERLSLGLKSYLRHGDLTKAQQVVTKMPLVLKRRKYYSGLMKLYARLRDTQGLDQLIERASQEQLDDPWQYLPFIA